MNTEAQAGLRAGDKAVPLEGVRVEARVHGASLEVTVTQRYRNCESVPVEAVYVFPLEESAAVCGFSALVGGKVVRGEVRERDDAFARYDDAMLEGHGAFLLDQERPNVFTASVGNLRPGEQVELQIRYVAVATREGNALRLAIPTTVSPRYVPRATPELGEPDGERVNPERWPDVPYGLTVSVNVAGRPRRVESPSHPIRYTQEADGARVELAQDDVALDRDFVLLVEPEAPQKPEVRVAREADGRRVAMLTFLPDSVQPNSQGHEVLFLLDCSGSMGGESIAQAKRALSLCVRALGADDTFNVVRFGTTADSLWKAPRSYDDRSLEEATRYVSRIDADLGGTEIFAPLKALLEAPRDPARPRRVLVLTDGQVSNEADVLSIARQHAEHTRIFAFGIGAGASEYLVKGMARASRGAAAFIFPGERIEPKVLHMFSRVRMPVLDDVRVDYGGLTVEQAPRRVGPVFAGDVLTVFARIESGSADSVTLRAGPHAFTIPLDLERAEAGGPIPTLWARECIRELDDLDTRGGSQQKREKSDTQRKQRLVELGTRYGLLSSATSYVAVEERAPGDETRSPAQLRRIPVALTSGWGGGRSPGGPMVVGSMAMPMSAPLVGAPAPMRKRGFVPMARAGAQGFVARATQAIFGRPGGAGHGDDDDLDLGAPMLEAPEPPRAPAPTDRLFDLLMTQRADGSFPLSTVLTGWLGSERTARMQQAFPAHDEALVITHVVMLLLAREEPTRASEWQPALAKAQAFCDKHGGSYDASSVVVPAAP